MNRTSRPDAGALLRVLGVGFGVAVLVGNTIGSGILRNPGEVAARLPSAGWFLAAWVAGGVYALLGSNALVEVAAMTPESGGYTVFVRRGLGPYFGFVAGWSDWLSTCSSASAASIVIAESVNALLGISAPASSTAAVIVCFFVLMQSRGVRSAGRIQDVTTLLKAAAFLFFIALCFMRGRQPIALFGWSPVPHQTSTLLAWVLAMQAVIFTYDGWVGPAYFAGELRDPGRELPRSVFLGLATVIVIYLLTNLGLLRILGIVRLAGNPFAAGGAALSIFGPFGESFLRVLVVLVLLSAINAFLLMGSRTFFAVSRATGFETGARVNAGGTPTIALLASAAAVIAFALSGGYERVIAVTAFLFVANYTFTYASLFALRFREPDAPRPYRAWGHPWTTGFVLLVSLTFMAGAFISDRANTLIAIALLLISFPIFRLLQARSRRGA